MVKNSSRTMESRQQMERKFMEVYDRYSNDIFRYCYYRVFDKDKAKDLVQEAYCRTWKCIIEDHEIKNIRAFIYKIVNNMIIDAFRKKKAVSLDYLTEKGFFPSVDPRPSNEQKFMNQEVLEVVNSLDKKYKDVIVLKYIKDLSVKEIALTLHQTENNVYVRMSRGFSMVKRNLTNHFFID